MALEGLPPDIQMAVGLRVPPSEQAALANRITGLYTVPPTEPLNPRARDAADAIAGIPAGIVAGGGALAVEGGLAALLTQQMLTALPDTPIDSSFPSPRIIGLGLAAAGVVLSTARYERGVPPPAFALPVAVGRGIANAVADSGIGSKIAGMAKTAFDSYQAQRRQNDINAWLKAEHIMPQSTI